MVRVSDYVIQFLESKNVKHIFTVTGGGAMFLNDAVAKSKKITPVFCHHEQACTMAAVSYSKVNNDLGVVMPTTGCGGTKTITGLLDAWKDSNKLLVIAGQVNKSECTYFSGLKLKWLLSHVPGLAADAKKGDALFGTMDTWLIWKLTGKHKTDVTNASRTQLMNLRTLAWDDEILAAWDIPKSMLPEIVSSSEHFGNIEKENFSGIPITGCLGDQQAALVGQTCFDIGMAKNTYGTGCFMLMNTGNEMVTSKHGLLTTVAYQLGSAPACYALEGSIAVAGSLIQWVRDNLGIIRYSADIEKLASAVPDNGDVYMVPAFSGLFTPYWRSDARGIIAGLTGFANKSHIARAVLEATAYQTLDVLKAMEADSGIRLITLNVDGGMVVNNLLMQFQADMVQVPVQRPEVNETTALGAAYAAGLAVGFWKNLYDLRQNHRVSRVWEPTMDEGKVVKLYSGWKKAVERSLGWV
jgi:glycerol kinase